LNNLAGRNRNREANAHRRGRRDRGQ
jgi:hypothetical protein